MTRRAAKDSKIDRGPIEFKMYRNISHKSLKEKEPTKLMLVAEKTLLSEKGSLGQ